MGGCRWCGRVEVILGYRLVALDVDGTLLNSAGLLTNRVKEAVSAVQRLGVLVTLATGRRLASASPIADALGITNPLVLHNGAVVADRASNSILNAWPLTKEQALVATDIARKYGAHYHVFGDPRSSEVALYDTAPPAEIASYYGTEEGGHVRRVTDLRTACPDTPLKWVLLDVPERAAAVAGALKSEMGDDAKVILFGGADRRIWSVEMFQRDVSKAFGIVELARRYGVAPSDVLAIGDEVNDLEMLATAGMGVAMGNASAEVQRAAREVTCSNDRDGVAAALERHFGMAR